MCGCSAQCVLDAVHDHRQRCRDALVISGDVEDGPSTASPYAAADGHHTPLLAMEAARIHQVQGAFAAEQREVLNRRISGHCTNVAIQSGIRKVPLIVTAVHFEQCDAMKARPRSQLPCFFLHQLHSLHQASCCVPGPLLC